MITNIVEHVFAIEQLKFLSKGSCSVISKNFTAFSSLVLLHVSVSGMKKTFALVLTRSLHPEEMPH